MEQAGWLTEVLFPASNLPQSFDTLIKLKIKDFCFDHAYSSLVYPWSTIFFLSTSFSPLLFIPLPSYVFDLFAMLLSKIMTAYNQIVDRGWLPQLSTLINWESL